MPRNVLKRYREIDSLISKAFSASRVPSKFYLAVQNGGFAIATSIDQIDEKGQVIKENVLETNLSSTFWTTFFSRQHFRGLFFSKNGRYRCIIIVVSPNLYTLGGEKVDYENWAAWLNSKGFRLPSEIGDIPLKENPVIVAMLYEFDQNENSDVRLQVTEKRNCWTKLSEDPLVKILNNGN